jgi:hypothetical protein
LLGDYALPKFVQNNRSMKTELTYEHELYGNIALVTGGTKGAGKAIAHRLHTAEASLKQTCNIHHQTTRNK